MPAKRTCKNPPKLTHEPEARLPDRPILREGMEATVILPPRTTGRRVRFLRREGDGGLTFVHEGRLRTVRPENVLTVHITTKNVR